MSCPKSASVRARTACLLLACVGGLALGPAQGEPATGAKAAQVAPQTSACQAASTGAATAAADPSLALQIQRINEHMALLQAQLNELELQAKISAKRREIDGAANTARSASLFDGKAGLPSVQSVAGLQGRLEAVLVFAGGATQRVKAGDVIEDRRVAKVSLNEVVLTDLHGRGVQRLPFGSAPLVRDNVPVSGAPAPLLALPTPLLGR